MNSVNCITKSPPPGGGHITEALTRPTPGITEALTRPTPGINVMPDRSPGVARATGHNTIYMGHDLNPSPEVGPPGRGPHWRQPVPGVNPTPGLICAHSGPGWAFTVRPRGVPRGAPPRASVLLTSDQGSRNSTVMEIYRKSGSELHTSNI